MKTVSGLHHAAMKVRDFDASLLFYSNVLGLTVRHTWMKGENRVAMLEIGSGNYLEIFEGGSDSPADRHFIHLAFACGDVDEAMEQVRQHGCQITVNPGPVTVLATPPISARNCFFLGPDGELIELFQQL